jgi:hypothetical protein
MGVLLFKGGVGVGMLKWQTSGSPCEQGEPNPCAVPLAKRGEPTEQGY